jgi:hypothetical protein
VPIDLGDCEKAEFAVPGVHQDVPCLRYEDARHLQQHGPVFCQPTVTDRLRDVQIVGPILWQCVGFDLFDRQCFRSLDS